MDLRHRHPAVLATGAIVIGLVAAVLAALIYSAVIDDSGDPPKLEAELHFGPEDQERPQQNGLLGRETEGEQVPTSTFTKLGGGLGKLTDYAGKPLVLNFFGSWCVPCRKEMPALQSVFEEFDGKVAFLGLAISDSEKSAQAFVDEHGVTYDIGRDPSSRLYADFGVVVMPSTFLVSADGTIVGKHAGALTAAKLRSLLADELDVR
jgi:peroxiredoxin